MQTVEVTFPGDAPGLPALEGVHAQSAGPNALRFEVSGSVAAAASVIAHVVVRRHPSTGASEGTTFAEL